MKQLWLITLIIIIMLGCTGIAYGSWSSDTNIGGSAVVGYFDVVFKSFTPPADVNGASFSANPDGLDPQHKYIITLNNLYPGLDAAFDFIVGNTGSIPAKITDIRIDGISVTGTGYQSNKDLPIFDGRSDITVSVQGVAANSTLGPNSNLSGQLTVHVWAFSLDGHDATPGANGNFTLEIYTAQQY
jgi:hypothetical protein